VFRFVIERGMLLTVGFLLLCLLGVIALRTVPVQMTPDLDKAVITVLTKWSGASPLDIEKEILSEQEEYLQNVRGLEKMTSTAAMGNAEVELEFSLGANMAEALVLVNNALSQVSAYPENVDQPRLVSGSSADDPFMFYTVSRVEGAADTIPVHGYLDFMEDEYATRLERIPGVAQVIFLGGARREVKVMVDPARLAARQLTMADVRSAVRARNRDMSGGDIDTGKRRFVVRTIGRYDSVAAINQTIIAERAGHSVLLSDVGYAELGLGELKGKGYLNMAPMLVFMVRREPGANVIEVKREVSALVAQLNETMLQPQNLVATLYADDVGYVVNAIRVVKKNLLLGGLLACLVLLLFLRSLYPTLLGALGLPICTIGAFIGLLLLGRTVNVISLAGVAFAIGMTLDNSIVVLENIYSHRLAGKSPVQASLDGVGEVWKAVLASTLTTVIVFLPIALIDNEAGQLYSDIAIAISGAVIMSMLVAMTLIPSAAARLPFRQHSAETRLTRLGQRFSGVIFAVLRWALGSTGRQLVVVVGTLMVAASVMLFLTPEGEYLPEGEEPKLFGMILPPPGYNLAEMEQIGWEVARDILAAGTSDDDASGASAFPPLDYFLWAVAPERIFTVSEPLNKDKRSTEQLQAALQQRFSEVPGMLAFVTKGSIFSGSSGGSRAIELDITGPDLGQLFALARQAYQLAGSALDGAQIRPDPGLGLGQPSIEIHPNWERARELGLSGPDLGYMVWALADGAFVDEFYFEDDKVDMYLYSTEGIVQRPEDIADLPLYSATGGVLPLSAIAEVHEAVSASRIRRTDGRRTVTLTIIPPTEVALERAVTIVQRAVIAPLLNQLERQKIEQQEKMASPEANMQQWASPNAVSHGARLQNAAGSADVNITIGGASDKLRTTRDALSGNFVVAIVLAYLLMVAIFSHWGYPLLILCSLPLGISGGLAGLWLMNEVVGIRMPLDMLTMLGMVVLIGTVVNNPILLVERARQNLAQGMEPLAAVMASVSARLRPIMMSMLTTIVGLAPVVFLPGAGTELYRGLGTIVLFGLFFSTLFTLSFIPSLLMLLFTAGEKWRVRR
jgi:multidrug efflux pump subunit AcrB